MKHALVGSLLVSVAATAAVAGSLLEAAKSGDAATARALIAESADVNVREPDGTSVLHWAVYHDEEVLVEELIRAGADVSVANEDGATPLSEAAIVGDPQVLEALLDAGADVDSPMPDGRTPLLAVTRASNVPAVKLLLERGADPNAHDESDGQTALMWAVAEQQPAMVRQLIAHGADVDARSKLVEWERAVTVEPRAKHLPAGGLTPLLYAAREGCVACAKALLEAGADADAPDPDQATPLLLALLNAHFGVAKVLIESGASVNTTDSWGRQPLDAAVDYDTPPLGAREDRPLLAPATRLAVIELVLEKGADPNAEMGRESYRDAGGDHGVDSFSADGASPLIRAASAGDVPAMKLLLEHGARSDLPRAAGITPLMAAAGLDTGDIDVRARRKTEHEALGAAKVLLEAGADVNARDARGQTALHGAAAKGFSNVVELLAKNAAELDAADANGATPLDAALGKLREPERTTAALAVHQETAALLERLLAEADGEAPR